MSRGTIELDFLGLNKNQTNNVPKPKFKKCLDRRRSFQEISKIDPEIIKSLLASGANHLEDSSTRTPSVPSTPKEIDQPKIDMPLLRHNMEHVSGTVPMTIFYDGTVSVFQVSPNKAENIMKMAMEGAPRRTDLSVMPPTTLKPKLFDQNLEGDLPIARKKSLQRFLEKRKERVVSTSPYSPTSA